MFHRIPVPTPFAIGRVNCYVAGNTVIDPGPDSDKSWATLIDGLAEVNLTPDDVEQVVITHPHLDHFGLGKRFKERGAEVVASPDAARVMADFPAHLEHEQAYFEPFFIKCGVDPEIADTVVTLPEPFLNYASNFQTDVEISAGDTITVADRTAAVDELAGHAHGELLFTFDDGPEDERFGIVGDHVLGHITPNPFLLAPPPGSEERRKQVVEFNHSLEWLAEQSFDRLLPGHGDPIDEPAGRIMEIRDAHERRTREVLDQVDGPTLPVEVVDALFEDLPLTELFLGMSEAIGHLDVLVDRDELVREETDEQIRYRPS